MKNLLIKYKLNIEEYENMYGFFINYIGMYIYNKKKKYTNVNEIIGIYYTFDDLINGYINHTEKDHLFELYTNGIRNFYICIGNLSMYDRNNKKYGDYFLVVNLRSDIGMKNFKIECINEYLKIEDFINKYKKVEDKAILDKFYKKIHEFNKI
jgi:hypothetical protein